jgi:ArsR family transcriptional regulator, arsenate/arsenite/antimonite-responsive transcriptional repressor
MSGVFKALADPTRRQVLALLRERPMSAGELSDRFEFSKPTMSQHFSVLREAGLIDASRHGKSIVYRLRMSVLEEALMELAGAVGLDLARADGGAAPLEKDEKA